MRGRRFRVSVGLMSELEEVADDIAPGFCGFMDENFAGAVHKAVFKEISDGALPIPADGIGSFGTEAALEAGCDGLVAVVGMLPFLLFGFCACDVCLADGGINESLFR